MNYTSGVMEVKPSDKPDELQIVVENSAEDWYIDPFLPYGVAIVDGVELTIGQRKYSHPFTAVIGRRALGHAAGIAMASGTTDGVRLAGQVYEFFRSELDDKATKPTNT